MRLLRGYLTTNIPGDTDSRRAYYDALELGNLSGEKEGFYRLIAGQVWAMGRRLVGTFGEMNQFINEA
ncbi:hypothetical protein MishRS11D_39310 [Methylomagnum ishizawai]|nr:hypothetical protein MishRS11D_39310 [Methylomagnum ishizawai]